MSRHAMKVTMPKVDIDQLKRQARERGPWLSGIAGVCMSFGAICLLLGAIVAYKSLANDAVPIQQPAALFAVGMLLMMATAAMWNYERWGRNIAVATTVCLGWVIAESVSRKLGGSVMPRVPVVLFAAVAISYFTGPTGRFLFRKRDKDQDEEGAA